MKLAERHKAIALRKSGHSMKEIARALDVSKSSVSLWVGSIPLGAGAKKRLRDLYTNGQLASQKVLQEKTAEKQENARREAMLILEEVPDTRGVSQLLCAIMYWCEGAKLYSNKGHFSFTNSDPALITSFLYLFRKSFDIDESKLRACVHLHSYHKEAEQLKFWSKMTSIPKEQFIRPYRKKESGKSMRTGYQGCISIRYHDVAMLRRVMAIAREFLKKTGL